MDFPLLGVNDHCYSSKTFHSSALNNVASLPPILFNSYPNNLIQFSNPVQIKSRIYVPSSVVGALIGIKGLHIKNMIQLTGAYIQIESINDASSGKKEKATKAQEDSPKNNQQRNKLKTGEFVNSNNCNVSEPESCDYFTTITNGNSPIIGTSKPVDDSPDSAFFEDYSSPLNLEETPRKTKFDKLVPKKRNFSYDEDDETPKKLNLLPIINETGKKNKTTNAKKAFRYVSIKGYDFQVYKAQFCIFQKVAELSHVFIDELELSTDTFVPKEIVGNIIGKNGNNVRELQLIAHASVNVLHDGLSEEDANAKVVNDFETPIRVTGNFFSLQAVQARFSTLIAIERNKALQKEFKHNPRYNNNCSI